MSLKYAAIAAIATLTIAACGTDQPAEVVEQAATETVTAPEDAIVVEEPEVEEPVETEEPEVEEASTPALGDTVAMGDWDVTVTKVVKNANDIIRQANEFNDQPEGQYVLVTIEGTYNGAERKANIDWYIDTYFVGADQVIYDEASQVTPSDSEDWPQEARNGATVQMQEVYDVAGGQVGGGILGLENYETGDFAEFSIG